MNPSRSAIPFALLLSALALVSCGDSGGPGEREISSVSITPSTVTLHPGQTRTLHAVAADAADSAITDATFVWTTTNGGVASVSVTGVVTAFGAGVDTITATSGSVVGHAVITVILVPVDSVSVTPTATTVHLTQTRQLVATPRDSAGNSLIGRAVSWQSSDTTLAKVSATGLVTPIAIGAVNITATSEGHDGVAAVTIDSTPVASVLLVPAGDTMMVGDTLTPVAVPKDSGGLILTGLTATWSVTDSSVLQPISGGRFVALANGAVTLSATIRGTSQGASVQVMTCGDTLWKSAGSFSFPVISGGLATDVSSTADIGLFKGNSAWFGGGVMYGTDSAHMVVAYDVSGNFGGGTAAHGLCELSNGPPYVRSYSKVSPFAGLAGPAGLRVVQETFHSTSVSADSGFILFRYTFTNTTGTAIFGLRTGFIVDWDLGNDPGANLLNYYPGNITHEAVESDSLTHTERLGVVGFNTSGIVSSSGWLNGVDPSTRGAYYARLAAGTLNGNSGPGDIRALAGNTSIGIAPYGRVVVYFAVVGGTTAAKFTSSRAAAKALADALGYN